MKLSENLQSELKSWVDADDENKLEREYIRYHRMIEEMLLNKLNLAKRSVLDIGCGPYSILNLLDCKKKTVIDPLIDDYNKHFGFNPEINYVKGVGEKMPFEKNSFDLVITMNSLDHCENPDEVIKEIRRVIKPSGYLAIHICINNAINNPHPSHKININSEWLHNRLDDMFETVSEKVVPYGWQIDKTTGKRGQPAIALLMRNCNFNK